MVESWSNRSHTCCITSRCFSPVPLLGTLATTQSRHKAKQEGEL